tara:strand:- start:122 stop:745 length:624 start_codon:yes stop_codon:yes gene_type:complete
MSYLAMTAAPIEYSNNSDNNSTQAVIDNLKKLNKQNRTRRRPISKIDNVVSSDSDTEDNEDSNNLGNFKPLPIPESAGVERRKEREVISDDERNEIQQHNIPSYINSSNTYSEQPAGVNDVEMGTDINPDEYKNKITAHYQQAQNTQYSQKTKNELTDKLNYLIHLLEEQHDEKTENVTEEVILYSFLGIFIIFVVDSFARVGKYVR